VIVEVVSRRLSREAPQILVHDLDELAELLDHLQFRVMPPEQKIDHLSGDLRHVLTG